MNYNSSFHRIKDHQFRTLFFGLNLMMARVLESRGLTKLFNAENITVFLPISEGFFTFDAAYFGIGSNDVQKWNELFEYGSQPGRTTISMLPTKGKITSRFNQLPLYVNRFSTPDGLIITINGATILQADIITDNGVIHIVDRMIAPVGSGMTIAEYLESPQIKDMSFSAIIMAAIIVPTLTQKTNSSKSTYTSFSPNDSYLYPMPEYGKEPLFNNYTILREVYQAHLIEDEALFLPAGISAIPDRMALHGKIQFYVRDGKMYVTNGRSHARIIQPNIPTVNGVIHVIDNLLHYVYHDALQIADNMQETKVFSQLMNGMNGPQKKKLTEGQITVFIPTDWAFSKVPLYWQAELLRRQHMVDKYPLTQLVYGHVIFTGAIDSSQFYDGKKLTMGNSQSLTLMAKQGEYYLETNDKKMSVKIEVKDIGVTNGVVHLVSNVLFADGYTIWNAVSDIPQLKRFYDVVNRHFPKLKDTLNMAAEKPSASMTVFLPSNEVFDRAADFVNSRLLLEPQVLDKALQGHVITGRFPSSRIEGEKVHLTFSGDVLKISRKDKYSSIKVIGGHVTSEIEVRDIFCSNGVIHIIDDLLHTPTRTIGREIKLREDLGYMQTLFEKVADTLYNLNSKNDKYTVFVPNNDAFSSLPWDTINKLLYWENWTKSVLRAHVIKNENRTLEEIPSGAALTAGYNVVYVLKRDGQVYVVNNNMMAHVVLANIPAVNGWIHIVDKILTVPYVNVADVLGSREEFSLFHQLMSPLLEYKQLISAPLRNVTLFVPSSRYLRTLTPQQMTRIKSNPDTLKKIFYGHVLPNVRLDDVFLRQYPEDDYCSRSSYNVTFNISRTKDGTTVDAGYDESMPLDLQGRAYGCSDGVIYSIDGILNYSPFTMLERLRRDPKLSASFELMTTLAPAADIELLNRPDLSFTFLMPDNTALYHMSMKAKRKFQSLPDDEKRKIFWRHVINGSVLYSEDFRSDKFNKEIFPPNVTMTKSNDVYFMHYKSIKSEVKHWNLLACNGVIHVLMQFLYDANGSGEATTPNTVIQVNPVTGLVGKLEGGTTRSSNSSIVSTFLFLALAILMRYR
ncbi:uncharacterized protein LOC106073270 isoform X3 [Biomphalaria glabrata]|uniref:Uncharacterized protein LOC106073270 isoform X3 n=1 Tax=Biomphalaria glabrata TaxID=6526 RepID=A0A9W2ZCA4_BIOGL|nr:uncharacterized protein LOC106073270 isoform X3 [Biomphalaria glabrata]